MRRMSLRAVALAATLVLPLAARTPLAAPPAASIAAARVIVKYRADSPLLQKQALTAAGRRLLQTQALGQRIGVALTPGRAITDSTHVVFAPGLTSQQLATRLAAQSDVEYAVVDGRKHIVSAPNDTYYLNGPAVVNGAATGGPVVGQWYLKPPGAAGTAAHTAPSAINAEQAWDVTTGSSSVVVAVIDTGIRKDHADLQGGNVLAGYDMISDAGTANDGQANGQTGTTNDRDSDASDTGDFVSQTDITNQVTGCSQSDVGTLSSWHGTQTLGLIGAATNNSLGIAGVGHGNVKVLPVRALGKCGGFDSDIAAAMYWAAGLTSTVTTGIAANPTPARVLSMSLGGSGSCDASAKVYTDAIAALTAAKVSIVVAAGNDSTAVAVPANCAGVIAVGGLRSLGDKNGFASLGPEVTISAPGGNCGNNDGSSSADGSCVYPIMSTSNSGTTTPKTNAQGGSVYSDAIADPAIGTSFSTPLVAGTVALMLSVQPSLTPAEIKAALQASARPFPTSGNTLVTTTPGLCVAPNGSQQVSCYCTTSTCGAGMLDAHAAVLAAAGAQARITDTTASPTAGQAVILSSSSVLAAGETIATYQWAITSAGATGVSIPAGAGNASTVTVTPTAAGSFTAQLTITDGTGAQFTTSTLVTVAAAPPPPSQSSGGGGGAIGAGWLLLLLGAVAALAAEERLRQSRRQTAVSASSRPVSRRR